MTTEANAAAPAATTQDTGVAAAPADNTTSAPAADASTSAPAPAEPVVPAEAPTATEKPAAPAPKAPEKYDFQGKDIASNVLEKFEGIAKELDMTQEQAAKFIDTVAPEIEAAQKARHESQVASWLESAKTDKEFGGEKLNENLAIAKKAIDAIGSPALVKLLDDTGLGNHPEIIRAFVKAGKQISSSNFVPSGQGNSQANNPGAKLYPDMK